MNRATIWVVTAASLCYLACSIPAAQLVVLPLLRQAVPALPLPRGQLPAFPGAEGFGSGTPGGRGGQVLLVTNLNDDGPGSLRAALAAKGPRIVIFRVGGTIQVERAWQIAEPFITIAGQTAPGDGITLRGAPLSIRTHDVIVRGLRIRVGDKTPKLTAPDGLAIGAPDQPVYNVIVDHCSISWAIDENVSTYQAAPVFGVSIQWNVISEGLMNNRHPEGAHSMGLLVGDNSSGISIHHNLFAHNNRRNPVIKGNSGNRTAVEVINNVVYNWGERATHFLIGSVAANLIGNYYKPGPNSAGRGVQLEASSAAATQLYVQGNIGPGRTSNRQNEWAAVAGTAAYRSSTPAMVPSGIKAHSATMAYDLVLTHAGATTPQRDAIDQRIVEDVQKGHGRLIDSQAQVGGWVTMRSAAPPPDTDDDGMPDSWEIAHGRQPTVVDGSVRAPSGYTYVEEYINSLLPLP